MRGYEILAAQSLKTKLDWRVALWLFGIKVAVTAAIVLAS